ncbi:hypothetical protein MKX03_006402, partial [Papaver bracteatum]
MPPTKRFRDMKQLSDGEKTVALLFSIHRRIRTEGEEQIAAAYNLTEIIQCWKIAKKECHLS